MHLIFFILTLFFCFGNTYSYAQDTLGVKLSADTALPATNDIVIKKRFQPDAKRAGLYSALLPGLGQIYNRQYWKAPIVWAAMGTPLYLAISKNKEYRRYRTAYISRLANGTSSNDEYQGILTDIAIKTNQDAAKQNSDMMVVFTVIGFAGQILEAISGAHLRNFDISQDLTMQVSPILTPINTLGIGLVVNFKK